MPAISCRREITRKTRRCVRMRSGGPWSISAAITARKCDRSAGLCWLTGRRKSTQELFFCNF